ncbi:unnamed protein product [Caretta caretta]
MKLCGKAGGGTAAPEELLVWGRPAAHSSAPSVAVVPESPAVQKPPAQREDRHPAPRAGSASHTATGDVKKNSEGQQNNIKSTKSPLGSKSYILNSCTFHLIRKKEKR